MADIDNPLLAKFVREVARPAAETLSAAEVNMDFAYDRWVTDYEPSLAGVPDGDVILEGRGDVTPLTVGELKAVFASIQRMRTANTTAQRRDLLKARVRILQAG